MGDDDWMPTMRLRFVVPPYTTTFAPRLQQQWWRLRTNEHGHTTGQDEEWRDVPREVEAP